MDISNKKLLILGGANVHCKVVEAARELQVYTGVTDYLQDSPAKAIADASYMYSITDIDEIARMCKEEAYNGVLSTHLDPGQRPYQAICSQLSFPCYCTADQVYRFTDKQAFKRMCRENGVDVIQDYSTKEVEQGTVEYPLFIKPVDSRGSRGQSICTNRKEALHAIEIAKRESSNNGVLIESYIGDAQEVQITYFVIDGVPYLIRTADSYCGLAEYHLQKVVSCSVSPSRYTDIYLQTAHQKICNMIQNAGIQNGPVFMQGFYDKGTFRFFDPGIRFPGVEFEKIYRHEYNVDLMKMMVEFAISGCFSNHSLPAGMYCLNGKLAAILFPTVSQGIIGRIDGVNELLNMPEVISYTERHTIGSQVNWSHDVNQRMAEIVLLCDSLEHLKQTICTIQRCYRVLDTTGHEMTYGQFDPNRIKR